METKYHVDGMNCASCARKIEQGLASHAEAVRVDFATKRLELSAAKTSFDDLNKAIAGLGSYKLSPIKESAVADHPLKPYFPLILIVGYLSVVSFAGADNAASWMQHFMAGFFLVFSFFKLLNLQKFADSYASYDLLAARWKPYGLIYPFLELALGVAYLFNLNLKLTLYFTLALTIFSAVGVLRSMSKKQAIRCACLGDLLNVPVSTVTLVEDFSMAAMALYMLAV